MGNWDKKFLDVAALVASWSKDPSTKVGCVITDEDHNILSSGYNGFPRGIADDERIDNRECKIRLIAHAEANAVAAAARNGHALKGGTVYITLPPCSQCAALLIQAGVRGLVYLKAVNMERWAADWDIAQSLLTEAGIQFEEVEGLNGHPSAQESKIVSSSQVVLYKYLDEKFLTLMNDVGHYGHGKYGADSFHTRALLGDKSRGSLVRTEKEEILFHARRHIVAYEDGVKHDHFGDLDHQLAAAAFNLLMEYYFSRGE